MGDINNRADIERLMEAFYSKALADDVIGYIFTDVAHLDLAHHLPIITDFWEMMLFRTVNFQEKYGRSPMYTHMVLDEKEHLRKDHFERWLKIFCETVDEMFTGENAEVAKVRAFGVARTMVVRFSRESDGVLRAVPG